MCNATVLVIDDNPLDRQILKTAFEKSGIKAITLGEPLNSVEFVKEHKPDFIVLDLHMPNKSGFEVCRDLKVDPSTRDIPVVFISGTEGLDEDNASKSIHLGVIDYLHKPVSIDYLVEQVVKHELIKGITDVVAPMKQEMRSFYEKYKHGL